MWGAGSGFFTVRLLIGFINICLTRPFMQWIYTPAMLQVITRKSVKITPFLAVIKNIAGSIVYTRRYTNIPKKFDAIFSTLVLHHCVDVENVFMGVKEALNDRGKAVVIDLCDQPNSSSLP